MKIGIDIDGTLMEHPDIYRQIIASFRAAGHEVGVLTGRPPDDEAEDRKRIAGLNIEIDFYFNTRMFSMAEKTMEAWAAAGKVAMDRDDVCCAWKARMTHELQLDMLFDDAADKIRQYKHRPETIIVKSPTKNNMVVPKWEEHHIEYAGVSGE